MQTIFNDNQFNFEELNKYANNKKIKMIKAKIEEWKDKKLLNGYFGNLANSLYKRLRIKNSEILQLLIYGAYIEEQNKLKEPELDIMKEDVNYYYKEGQREANNTLPQNKRKSISLMPDSYFGIVLGMMNAQGYIWDEYQEMIMQYNAQQMYRQVAINIQQNKENDIYNNVFQNIIKKQQNTRLNINGDKISGAVDSQLIGMNNRAKVDGMLKVDNDTKVRFIAVEDKATTPMCHSLDGQIFSVNNENEFNRYYGETSKDLRIEKIKCKGLVIGLNLPPISHHFHYCRSTITYQVPAKENDINTPQYIKSLDVIEDNDLNNEINKAIKEVSNKVYKLLIGTKFEKSSANSYYDRKKDIIYVSKDAKMYDIIHEIGHVIETKEKIMYNSKYIDIQKQGLGNVLKSDIKPIQGYPKQNGKDVLFLDNRNKFISEYQRRVYYTDINGKTYYGINGFNAETLGDYFSEGYRYYIIDKDLVKMKDIKLYQFIKGMVE